MGLLPDMTEAYSWASLERLLWESFDEIPLGRVVKSLDELKRLVPTDGYWGEIYQDKDAVTGIDTFYRPYGKGHDGLKIAYYCPSCESIVAGPPRLKPYNTITLLAGSEGLEYLCTHCGNQLYDMVLKMS
jgi:hypothetical protein